MKYIILLVLITTTTLARPVYLRINHTQNGKPLELGKVVDSPDGTYDVKVTMLRYYVSGITIQHDGIETPLPNTYLLVDVSKSPLYYLGDLDVSRVEAVKFSIGVPVVVNHEDPSGYPIGHPLGHQDPSMHWGWAAGYRFVTFEGFAGRGATPTTPFQFHALGDELYTPVFVPARGIETDAALEIPISADAMALLTGIDATFGQIVHGSTDEAITVMQNFKTHVFANQPTSVNEDPLVASTITPQPASESVTVAADDLAGATVTVVDVTGQAVLFHNAADNAISLDLGTLPSGTYTVLAYRQGQLIARSPLCVVR